MTSLEQERQTNLPSEHVFVLATASPWQTSLLQERLNAIQSGNWGKRGELLLNYGYPLAFIGEQLFTSATMHYREHGAEGPAVQTGEGPWWESPRVVERWGIYRVPWSVVEDEGSDAVAADGSVQVHSGRQASITAAAALLDAIGSPEDPELHLSPEEVDLLIAVAWIHDLGEYMVGDMTYDKKEKAG